MKAYEEEVSLTELQSDELKNSAPVNLISGADTFVSNVFFAANSDIVPNVDNIFTV